MNIVYYNIFINLLVNHENDDIRQIWSICFNFCSSQNSYFVQIFFSRYKKSIFFVRLFSKMENKVLAFAIYILLLVYKWLPQYWVGKLVDWVMRPFFLIQSFWLLVFCLDDQEIVASVDYALVCFLLGHQS